MQFYLGPWYFYPKAQPAHFGPPPGTRCLLDLSPNHAPGSRGVFLSPNPLPLDYERVPEHRLIPFAWDALTMQAAPDGLGLPRPLVPETTGLLNLYLGPLGLVGREEFRWGKHPHTNRLRDQMRNGFRKTWEGGDRTHARRCLDYDRQKYGLRGKDWRELVPRDLLPHVPGPLPHATTYTDHFTYSDSTLESNGSWSKQAGQLNVVSSACKDTTGGAVAFYRWDQDLSSVDMTVQALITSIGGAGDGSYAGTCGRYASAADTAYWGTSRSTNGQGAGIWTRIAGSLVNLTNTGNVAATPFTGTLTCNGSTISYADGTNTPSLTDTQIDGTTVGGKRGGIAGFTAGTFCIMDDWQAADIGGGGTTMGAAQYYHLLG